MSDKVIEKTASEKARERLDKGKDGRSHNPDMLPWYLADKMTDPENAECYTEFTAKKINYYIKRAALSEMLANDELPDEVEVDGKLKLNPEKKFGLVYVDALRKWDAKLSKSLDRKSSLEIRDMVKSSKVVTTGTLGANLINPGLEEEQKKKHFWSGWFG